MGRQYVQEQPQIIEKQEEPAKVPITIFPPCLIDQVYPEMAKALVALFEVLGFEVTVRDGATCCGQPAFNSGYAEPARTVARSFCESHRQDTSVVCPSGSCAAMVRVWYPQIIQDPLRFKVFELSEFIIAHGLGSKIRGTFPGKIGYHASCHTVRELRVQLTLKQIFPLLEGFEERELTPVCCGFGGLFCSRFHEVAQNISQSRIEAAEAQGIEVLVSNDPGCIMQLRGEVSRSNKNMKVLHLAEFAAQAMGLVL